MQEKVVVSVAIIGGGGNLGSRHLQALALTQIPLTVEVVDVSDKFLDVAKERWNQMPQNSLVQSINFYKNIEDLKSDLDVVIVATSSLPRRSIVEKLLETKNVKYLVLEKVLFPKLSDYDAVQRLLAEKNVKTFVNCGRRNTFFYKQMRELFKSEKHVSMHASAVDLGLGCNTIHFLDTYCFISDQKNFESDIEYLNDGLIESKRKGYVEFIGTMRFKSKKGTLEVTSYEPDERNKARGSGIITIQSEHYYCIVRESENRADLLVYPNVSEWKKMDLELKFQSQLTQDIVKNLVEDGSVNLPTYEESAALHKVMLEGFLEQYNRFSKERADLCPIT